MKNYSKQREEILEVLKNPGTHLTADEIFKKAKLIDKTISKATVYRNLKELAREGIVWKISMEDGKVIYDCPGEKHNHAICLKCGNVKDFKYEFESENLTKSLEEQIDMDLNIETVTIYGICDECKSKF